MPEALGPLLESGGLWLLIGATLAAGLVRGFAGFGTGMIYLPAAGQVLDPLPAVLTLLVMDLFGPVPNVPRAWTTADKRELGLLFGGMVVALPFGLALLMLLPPEIFRYGVSVLTLALLVMLVGGLRYRGAMTRPLVAGTGGLAGLLGGVAGLPGPPVILLYMASPLPAAVVRATNLLFLFGFDLAMLALTGLQGLLGWEVLVLGLVLAVPNLVGNIAGGWLFRPGGERIYRAVAYIVIAVSALSGLPFWD
ncbi:TSUP family transporter [Aquicoccus sp. SCR17]|nr:TSUP family transporter [Carideicomes alvinocaridis]